MKINSEYIIYQGHHGGGNSVFADLILPGLAYSEKSISSFKI